jgi:hypothetical protein
MAGPIPNYLATQLAAQTAFNVPFGLLTLVSASITAATAAGQFNATVDCSLFAMTDVAALGVYLSTLGYKTNFNRVAPNKSLNIDWSEPLDITNVNTIGVTQGTVPWVVTQAPTANFDYVTGSLTAPGSVLGFGNCGGIRVFAVGVDSKFAISGGAPITVRANQTFYHVPQSELLNPTIDWFAGSIDVWLEVEGALPPSIPDLGMSLGIAHL